jgi:hypothetical protein
MKAHEGPFEEEAMDDLKSEPPTQVDFLNPLFAFSPTRKHP